MSIWRAKLPFAMRIDDRAVRDWGTSIIFGAQKSDHSTAPARSPHSNPFQRLRKLDRDPPVLTDLDQPLGTRVERTSAACEMPHGRIPAVDADDTADLRIARWWVFDRDGGRTGAIRMERLASHSRHRKACRVHGHVDVYEHLYW